MERLFRKQRGVTLLEILLVLAIASIIIVLSIRYYQSANTAQQANGTMQVIQSIASGMDNLAATTGAYTGFNNAALSSLTSLNINNSNAVLGASVTVSATSAAVYSVTINNVSLPACTLVKSRLAVNTKYPAASVQCTGGRLTYQYNNLN